MNFPTKIRIGGCDLKIKFSKKIESLIENKCIDGQCKLNTGEIKIATLSSMNEEIAFPRIIETLLHETFHAIDVIYNGDRLKESTIEHLTTGWFSVLSSNEIDFFKRFFVLPKKVFIHGINYTIIEKDDGDQQSYLDFYGTKIYISSKIEIQYVLKFLLTTPITDAILKASNVSINPNMIGSISHGITQVFGNYPFYELIRGVSGKVNSISKRDNRKNREKQPKVG